jgi:hypothetical protein
MGCAIRNYGLIAHADSLDKLDKRGKDYLLRHGGCRTRKLERRLAAGFQRDFWGKAECNSALRFLCAPVQLFCPAPHHEPREGVDNFLEGGGFLWVDGLSRRQFMKEPISSESPRTATGEARALALKAKAAAEQARDAKLMARLAKRRLKEARRDFKRAR